MNPPTADQKRKIVYWHRDYPPLTAELVAEHTIEANSTRIPGTIAHRDELWNQCYRELMEVAEHLAARALQLHAVPRTARLSYMIDW